MAKHPHHHTGRIKHKDMVMHNGSSGLGGKDKHAHPSHHQANKAMGMSEGLSPCGEYDGGEERMEHGGEGMAGNVSYE